VRLSDSHAGGPDPDGLKTALIRLILANEPAENAPLDDLPLDGLLASALNYKTS
jgi:hypothetical protein